MNYCHVAGRFSGRGCVICTGGCSIVRWINHLALIAAKLFEMYETQKLAVRALTYVSFPRNVLFGLAAFRRRQRKEERKRERERERERFESVENDLYPSEGTVVDSVAELLFVWHSDLLGPRTFFFFFSARLSGTRRKKGKIQGMNIYQPLAGISRGNSYVSRLFCWIT